MVISLRPSAHHCVHMQRGTVPRGRPRVPTQRRAPCPPPPTRHGPWTKLKWHVRLHGDDVEPGTRLRTVEHNNLIASIQQVLRHARTHVAKANYANGGASDRVLGEGTCTNHASRCHSLSVRYKGTTSIIPAVAKERAAAPRLQEVVRVALERAELMRGSRRSVAIVTEEDERTGHTDHVKQPNHTSTTTRLFTIAKPMPITVLASPRILTKRVKM